MATKRITTEQYQNHYDADVRRLGTPDLCRILRSEGFAPRTPRAAIKAMQNIATLELQARGIELPLFYALTAY